MKAQLVAAFVLASLSVIPACAIDDVDSPADTVDNADSPAADREVIFAGHPTDATAVARRETQIASLGDGWLAQDIPATHDSEGGVVLTRPATAEVTADVTPWACHSGEDGWLCLFQNKNGGGTVLYIDAASYQEVPSFVSYTCKGCTNGTHGNNGTFNDQMTSWENDSIVEYCWFKDINYKGTLYTMGPYYQETVSTSTNDTASSAAPCAG